MIKGTFYLISLGCAKNLVESEKLTRLLSQKGYHLTDEIEDASLIIINTCGFIQDAKKESIQTILDVIEEKKKTSKIVVFGCMVQRYLKEIKEAIPEVNLFLPVLPLEEIADIIVEKFPPPKRIALKKERKILFTPQSYAYIKVSDGCENYCSYCAIPAIRGVLKSRSIEEITEEVKGRLKNGAVELNIIAQDITSYGKDLYGRPSLEKLLREILKVKGDYWLRLLYLYPTRISEELIRIIANEERIVKYLDIPLQHSENKILTLMNRHYTKEKLFDIIENLRNKIPNLVLRTSFIVGFPGETEDDFFGLSNFVKDVQFDHIGVFPYSPEEGTRAIGLKPKITAKVKAKRRKELMNIQREIVAKKNRILLGKTFSAIMELPVDDYGAVWTARIYRQAPEVDGVTYVTGYTPQKGFKVTVKICDTKDYDFIAEMI